MVFLGSKWHFWVLYGTVVTYVGHKGHFEADGAYVRNKRERRDYWEISVLLLNVIIYLISLYSLTMKID